jgi:hypothetical protein
MMGTPELLLLELRWCSYDQRVGGELSLHERERSHDRVMTDLRVGEHNGVRADENMIPDLDRADDLLASFGAAKMGRMGVDLGTGGDVAPFSDSQIFNLRVEKAIIPDPGAFPDGHFFS